MTGLEAISAHNGWAIAAVGISIVFTGLTVLSLIISQLHKVLKLWDDRGTIYRRMKEQRQEKKVAEELFLRLPQDVKQSARQFRLLTDRMGGDPFSLLELLDLADKCGLPRPHSALNDLILAKRILPDGKGYFWWNE